MQLPSWNGFNFGEPSLLARREPGAISIPTAHICAAGSSSSRVARRHRKAPHPAVLAERRRKPSNAPCQTCSARADRCGNRKPVRAPPRPGESASDRARAFREKPEWFESTGTLLRRLFGCNGLGSPWQMRMARSGLSARRRVSCGSEVGAFGNSGSGLRTSRDEGMQGRLAFLIRLRPGSPPERRGRGRRSAVPRKLEIWRRGKSSSAVTHRSAGAKSAQPGPGFP